MTYNGVEKMSKRRSKMMEKMTKRRPKKMDKKRKKEAETGWLASQPAKAGPHPVPAGLGRPPGRPPS